MSAFFIRWWNTWRFEWAVHWRTTRLSLYRLPLPFLTPRKSGQRYNKSRAVLISFHASHCSKPGRLYGSWPTAQGEGNREGKGRGEGTWNGASRDTRGRLYSRRPRREGPRSQRLPGRAQSASFSTSPLATVTRKPAGREPRGQSP